jgi:hypothetical protein
MTDTPETRYYDLKGDTTRVEVNVQEHDETYVLDGPTATSEPGVIAALDENPSVKAITLDAYTKATDVTKLTVKQLDERFGSAEGYPASGNRDAKLAFAKTEGGNA